MLDPESGPESGPAPVPVLSRRRMLANSGRGLLALALVGTATVGCGPSQPPGPDPLEAQLQASRQDSELATEAAKAAPPPTAAALREVAAQRARHADALVEELARAAGEPIPTETTTSAAPVPSDKPAPPPTVADVMGALRKSADSAAELVPALSGYRAGLLGSIAASCTAAFTVALTTERKQR